MASDRSDLASLLAQEALQSAAKREKAKKKEPDGLEEELSRARERLAELEQRLKAAPEADALARAEARIAQLEQQLRTASPGPNGGAEVHESLRHAEEKVRQLQQELAERPQAQERIGQLEHAAEQLRERLRLAEERGQQLEQRLLAAQAGERTTVAVQEELRLAEARVRQLEQELQQRGAEAERIRQLEQELQQRGAEAERVRQLEQELQQRGAEAERVRQLEQELQQRGAEAERVRQLEQELQQRGAEAERVRQLEQELQQRGAEAERVRQLEQELQQRGAEAERVRQLEQELQQRGAEAERVRQLEHELREQREAQAERVFQLEQSGEAEERVRHLEQELMAGERAAVALREELRKAGERVAELEHHLQTAPGGELQEQLRLAVERIHQLERQPPRTDPELERMAYEDRLTGLPNENILTRFLQHSIASAAQNGTAVGLLLIDFDHFKQVNDRFGPALGDKLLRRSAAALREALPPEMVVGRRGEDEFLVVLTQQPGTTFQGQLHQACTRIVQAVAQLGELDGKPLSLTVSIGVSTAPVPAQDPDELVTQAETALYRAKEQGRNRIQLYDSALQAHLERERAWQHSFYDACQRGSVRPFYRPIVNLGKGALIGAEIGLEWFSNQMMRGIQLDELVEKCGLGPHLGGWLLEQACHTVRVLGRNSQVVVRLLPGQLFQPDFATYALRTIEQMNVKTAQVFLEPRVEDFRFDPQRFTKVVEELARWKVGLVFRDVNLFLQCSEQWHQGPGTYLRITEDIVRDTPDADPGALLCAGLVRLADRARVSSLVEGVTTRDQVDFLRLLECTAAQGPLFGEVNDPQELKSLV